MSELRFRIMGGPSVPWRMVEPYEDQARTNHEQSLKRLNERGGLCPRELWCIVHGKRLREMPSDADARAWLDAWLAADIGRELAELRALRLTDEERSSLKWLRDHLTVTQMVGVPPRGQKRDALALLDRLLSNGGGE